LSLLGTAEEDGTSLYFSVSVGDRNFEPWSEGLSVCIPDFFGSSVLLSCLDSRSDFPPVMRLFYIISITLKSLPVPPCKKSTPVLFPDY
jgi:hypothetical protein